MKTIMEMISATKEQNNETDRFSTFHVLSENAKSGAMDAKSAAEGYAIRIMQSIGPRSAKRGKSACKIHRTAVWQTLSNEKKDALQNN